MARTVLPLGECSRCGRALYTYAEHRRRLCRSCRPTTGLDSRRDRKDWPQLGGPEPGGTR